MSHGFWMLTSPTFRRRTRTSATSAVMCGDKPPGTVSPSWRDAYEVTLKPLDEQVMVITGASSGIGLVTATHAAQHGACVVLAARNGKDLQNATERIRQAGGRATYAIAGVADAKQVDAIADTAIRVFGRIDTWVNNAAVSMYGRIMEL